METRDLFKKVYGWMFIGLLVSFVTAYFTSTSLELLNFIYSNSMQIVLIILELILVIYLSSRINKMSIMSANVCFLLYSFVTGLTLSVIFVSYNMPSLIYIFAITSALFLILSIMGYVTKIDLSRFGTVLLTSLILLLVVYLINIFVGSDTINMLACVVGLVIFVGLVAYDTQKIKNLGYSIPDENKLAIIGALELYLDFINIFLNLLQLFGKSKD